MSQSHSSDFADGCTCRGPDTAAHARMNPVLKLLQHVASRVGVSIAMTRQPRVLRGLDNRLLDDIGLSRSEVKRESETRFWRSYARRHLK